MASCSLIRSRSALFVTANDIRWDLIFGLATPGQRSAELRHVG
jgi:hypothetical protein